MNVVIIGSSGQLGSDLLKKKPGNVNVIGLTHRDIEISDYTDVHKKLGELDIDFVINTAAFHNTEKCEEYPDVAFLTNAVGVKNIVDVCLKKDIPLLHISTDYVFDGSKLQKREPYYESDQPKPINIYGISKYAGESIISSNMENYYIIRTSSLYGLQGVSSKGGNFPLKILMQAREKGHLKVVNDIFMSPTFTEDLADSIWRLVTERMQWGIYHIVNSGYCSWYEFAQRIIAYAGVKCSIVPVSHKELPSGVKRPLWSVLGTKKELKLPEWYDALNRFIRKLNS